MERRSAFTLIELLVVIAIIAILAVVVVLTLNPAQLLAQSRDADRISDLATLNSAISLYQTDAGGGVNFSLGSSSVAYLSIPDPTANSDCSDLGANFLAGGYFHCASLNTYRNASSTGWVPINFDAISSGAPFSSLPIDPVNNTSSNLYYSYQTNGNTFHFVANPESQKYQTQLATNPAMFASGSNPNMFGAWVPVPGNSQFGTGNFMVMKCDASCANMATGAPLATPLDGNGYQNTASGAACSTANGLMPISLALANPIVDVTEVQAKQYCASIGAHLLTNDEWMTINTNAVNQGMNWSSGLVGSGYAYSGHNDNAPGNVLVASSDDTQGYYGETNQGGNQKRTYTLSNGSVVWDMAGNLWQEVQRSTMNSGDNTNSITPPTCSNGTAGWEWCQWNSTTPYVTAYNDASFNASTVAPPNASWGSSQGMGQLYTWGSGANQNTNAFIRGNSWNNGSAGGPFALYLNWSTGSTSAYVGFRCAR